MPGRRGQPTYIVREISTPRYRVRFVTAEDGGLGVGCSCNRPGSKTPGRHSGKWGTPKQCWADYNRLQHGHAYRLVEVYWDEAEQCWKDWPQ